MTCTCVGSTSGVRCAEADRLWDAKQIANENVVRGTGGPLRMLTYLRALRAYNSHVNSGFEAAQKEVAL